MNLRAQSRLVGADQVYRAHESLTVYVVDVRHGWVTADVYHGTSRGERIRITRSQFRALFSNHSETGEPREEILPDDGALCARAPRAADHSRRVGVHGGGGADAGAAGVSE